MRQRDMPTIDLEYDEDRGNTPRPECPISISRDEDFYKATADVMGYDSPEDGDDSYAIAPHITFERLARESVVEDPDDLSGTRLLPACLHASFLAGVIDAAVELGVLRADDEDDDVTTEAWTGTLLPPRTSARASRRRRRRGGPSSGCGRPRASRRPHCA